MHGTFKLFGPSHTDQLRSPVLYRFLRMLTAPSELPALPEGIPGYSGIHGYTATQIMVTVGIFIMTLTIAGPAFPIIIAALVPIRLLVMSRIWNCETLRYVDAWACRAGTPEDDEDAKSNLPLAHERPRDIDKEE